MGELGARAPQRPTPLRLRTTLPGRFYELWWAILPLPTRTPAVLSGRAIIFVQEGPLSRLRVTPSRAQKIRLFSPAGGAAFFTARILFRRELTRFICYSPRRRGSRRT